MRTLADLLIPERITWLETTERDPALRELLGRVASAPEVRDPQALSQAIFSRDVLMDGGLGYGVAIPHARIPSMDGFVLSMGICPDGFCYEPAKGHKPVRLIVLVAGPDQDHERYLQVLSALLKFVKSEKGHIMACRSAESICEWARAYPLLERAPRAAQGSRF